MGPATPEEMGECSAVFQKEFGAKKVTVFEQAAGTDCPVASIVLRSSAVSVNNDLEPARADGLSCAQQLSKAPGFVPAAGATEIDGRSSGAGRRDGQPRPVRYPKGEE